MADTAVAVTAGTGTNIDTRTEATNGNHRQVVVLGDPSTNAGVAPVDATAGLKVDLGADNDVVVTNAGTFATQATLQAGTAEIGKLAAGTAVIGGVNGDVAHDAADSGNPVKVGARATNSVEGQTQVAQADRTDVLADLNGVLITRPYTTQEEILSERVSNTDGAATALTTFDAGGAGVHNYVTTIIVHNASATDGYIDIRDGVAGAVLMTIPLPTLGGAVINLPVPLKGSANTALAYDVSAALTTVYLSLVGYQGQG